MHLPWFRQQVDELRAYPIFGPTVWSTFTGDRPRSEWNPRPDKMEGTFGTRASAGIFTSMQRHINAVQYQKFNYTTEKNKFYFKQCPCRPKLLEGLSASYSRCIGNWIEQRSASVEPTPTGTCIANKRYCPIANTCTFCKHKAMSDIRATFSPFTGDRPRSGWIPDRTKWKGNNGTDNHREWQKSG